MLTGHLAPFRRSGDFLAKPRPYPWISSQMSACLASCRRSGDFFAKPRSYLWISSQMSVHLASCYRSGDFHAKVMQWGGRSNSNEAIPCDHLADLVMSLQAQVMPCSSIATSLQLCMYITMNRHIGSTCNSIADQGWPCMAPATVGYSYISHLPAARICHFC